MQHRTQISPLPCFLFFLVVLSACRESGSETTTPQYSLSVSDDHLTLELIDEAPDIMTPIGLTIDPADALFLLESHTHTPPKDYPGPAFDRIKKGMDQDGDGSPESWQIYADSISDGMNLAAGPDGTIYLACKDLVAAFRDENGDGQSDRVDTLLYMKAGGDIYDHAGIMGVTLSSDGWLYVSRGNTGGLAWEMTAADGTTLSNYGDGGNVVRLTADGGRLEEVATGFWNPFDIQFTANGHLMLTDNDPDSRGPNRLIDLVYGGDYGYKSLYGGSGIHPFLAWNGELPGTLPYAAPLGEAPCGLIDAGFTNFGPDYRDHILAAVWEENSIVKIPLGEDGQMAGPTEILVKGDSTFHPVAFATNSRGELFFTDWVVRQYPNHRQGRLWKLSSDDQQTPAISRQEAIAGGANNWIYRSVDPGDPSGLESALKSDDPYTRAVARKFLSRPEYTDRVTAWLVGNDDDLKLQALLTLFHNGERVDASVLAGLLRNDQENIRNTALKYIALRSRSDLYDQVNAALPDGYITPALFASYLAAVRHLQPNFIEQYQNKARRLAKQLERRLPDGFLLDILQNTELPAPIRAAVLPQLDLQEVDPALLVDLLENGAPSIQMALLQLFTRKPVAEAIAGIQRIAANPAVDPELRNLALLSLSYQSGDHCGFVADLLPQATPELAQIGLRYLCRCRENTTIQNQITAFLQDQPEAVTEVWRACDGLASDASRPASSDAWLAAIDGSGRADRGKWVFYSRKAQCQNCHMVDEWGSDFGPALSNIGSSKSKVQLLTAILEPSAEISPEWQGWYITDAEGKTHYGRQIDVGLNNAELLLASGEFVTYERPQSYGMAPTSLMPDGLENQLSVSEMNDLIAYLLSLR
ncbi:PVC-type heme-binding CxxCH protein [Flavilitoribacter nigricans]|uniref:Dehydrogenase n=1 Tax=Flavilitoribacter nigricans (strain ATCC 23147 / DSM 23189 / NBRC 102662 / NCIMB 1420 / SS-2) TaxID=1122177 RepID=A0A2D0NGK0_FLAN2|nr:PVC-type heme-binding CxxCH protein [Flavilitoribacter nigricans]PHN07299.1 dehydrogenase [Flavilitoribacter nigricans DSM 23189 = NBRC 102662]